MSDPVNLTLLGELVRTIQADLRSLRGENRMNRAALHEALSVLVERVGNFEAYIDTRLDQHRVHIDQRLSAEREHLDRRLDALAQQIGQIEH